MTDAYDRTNSVKIIRTYLESGDVPLSQLAEAWNDDRRPIVEIVKNHFNLGISDCIGLDVTVRDAMQNMVLAGSLPLKTSRADSCAECGVLAPDHAPNCGSVSMYDNTCTFRDYGNHQCQRKAGHSGLHDTTGHICDPSATPPITPEACPACLAVVVSAQPNSLTSDMLYARIAFEGWRNDAGTRTLYLGELSIAVVHYHTEIDKELVDHLIRAVNAHGSLIEAVKLFLDLDGHSVSDTAIAVNAGLAALELAEGKVA